MRSVYYWAAIAVFSVAHLFFQFDQSIYHFIFSLVLIVGALSVVYKKGNVQIHQLGIERNGALFALQLLPFGIYVVHPPVWLSLIPLIMFVSLEKIRLAWGNEILYLQNKIQQTEEEKNRINDTLQIVRKERHDYLKHIAAIHYMLEKSEEKEVWNYVNKLVDTYEETNLSIKGEKGPVAGILHHLYQKAKENRIELIYDFDIPLSSMPFADHEIVSLVGNLLSNGVEAAGEWQKAREKQGSVTVQFYKRSGIYILTCSNNCLPIPNYILDGLFTQFGKTTKGDDHDGMGTKIIKDIVDDHQGFLDFTYKKETFTVKIKIPAIS